MHSLILTCTSSSVTKRFTRARRKRSSYLFASAALPSLVFMIVQHANLAHPLLPLDQERSPPSGTRPSRWMLILECRQSSTVRPISLFRSPILPFGSTLCTLVYSGVVEVLDWNQVGSPDELGTGTIDLGALEPFEQSQIDVPLDTQGSIRIRMVFQVRLVFPDLSFQS
jgi:hypothetical protein